MKRKINYSKHKYLDFKQIINTKLNYSQNIEDAITSGEVREQTDDYINDLVFKFYEKSISVF